jgi:acetyltransferase-like isoleucine patch superfamily enzyme
MKQKGYFRVALNRILHLLARFGPGATRLRPILHRLRGVKIHGEVFIGDDVYLENEYPECVEIHDSVQISVRAMILAHTRGPGKVIIEKDAYIGPNSVIVTSGGRVLRIGEGAVISAGCVITKDVGAHTFVSGAQAKAIARARVPLTKAECVEDFIRGLAPIKHTTSKATPSGAK